MIGIELDRLARRVRDMNERIAAIEAWARGLPDHPMPSGPAEEQPAIVAQAKDGPAAQAGLPAAEVAVTTENLDVCERRIENSKGKLERYEYSPGDHDECGLVAFWEAKRAAKVDIRANLARVQAEHARAREADRRRIEELEANEVELRAMVSGAQRERDFEHGNWFEASHLATLNGKHAAMASERLAEARKEQAKEFERAENLTAENADLRRQLGEAQAEVADLLPRLDADALENTQLGRERDGARNELATMREDFARVSRELTELRQQVAVTVDTTAKVASEAVDRLTKENADLRAKAERRTALVEQALEGRRSNWKLSQWFDWEHTALAELATDAPRDWEG